MSCTKRANTPPQQAPEALMQFEIRRFRGLGPDNSTDFRLWYRIALDGDDGVFAGDFGLPYLKAFWERHGHGEFTVDQACNRRIERVFPDVEAAAAYERDLIASCQADLHYWQQADRWAKAKSETILLTPAPYSSERGTGT